MRNFVIFQLDQLSWRALKTYGSAIGSTPNIDALAENGIAAEAA